MEKITFDREKETVRMVRFQERTVEGKPSIIGTLYVSKWWAGSAESLTVTIEKEK